MSSSKEIKTKLERSWNHDHFLFLQTVSQIIQELIPFGLATMNNQMGVHNLKLVLYYIQLSPSHSLLIKT